MNRQFGRDIGNLPDSIALHLDHGSENISLNIKNELFPTKNVSSKSVERQNDIPSEVVPSQRNENAPPKYVLSPKSLNPVNKYKNIADKRLRINKDMDGTSSITKTLSVDQMSASDRSENTPLKHIFSTKCFNPVNKYANTVYERKNTQKDIDDLRNHNDVVEICDFQRMILVLGDRQGIEYVLSTSHNSEGSHENLEENSTKRKKKPKKKTSEI
ncbi:hypothetical protein AVEN_82268-1 [Araneus ventricosus]|uniref:Uncharacterized protein n=1 Tax=Araneus ventricosus TaxID=182803 RepID=A0A4Y2HDR7_ARAVE|nr:hypothetical protein AVEN_82268-1 [Araneus ventricosus]